MGDRVVLAAGGVVRRSVRGRPCVAVVHRPRHGGDWVLPKGKLAPGDPSLRAAALREVEEEVGCTARERDIVGTLDYPADDTDKVVVFWLMDYLADSPLGRGASGGEVDDIRWLPIGEATALLTYPQERRLLESVRRRGLVRAGRRRWALPRDRLRLTRLARAIERLELDLDQVATATGAEGDKARGALALARLAHDAGDRETGWSMAYAASEALAELWDAEQRRAAAATLRQQAESGKFSDWRSMAIRSLLDDPAAVTPVELSRALRIQHEAYENRYFSLEARRRHQAQLLWFGGASGTVSIVLLLSHAGQVQEPGQVATWWAALSAILLGVLGAVVSAAQRAARLEASRIPDQMQELLTSLSRVPIGAVAGLLAWLGAIAVTDVGSAASVSPVLIAAFGAGFAERLFTQG